MNATAPAKTAAKALGLVLAAVLALSGCSFAADITTSTPYAPSDGVRAEVGAIHAQNLLVVVPAEGEAVLIGSLTNDSREAVGVEISHVSGDAKASARIDANSTLRLGTEFERTLRIDAASVKPGGLAEIRIGATGGDSVTLKVPVVDGTLPEYRDLF